MSKSKRVSSKEFKVKVVLEVLKEKNIIEVLAKKYKLVTNQFRCKNLKP